MSATAALAVALMLGGAFFFLAGTAGLLRFPDVYGRLHTLTKADNLGLGLVIVGVMLLDGTWHGVLRLLLVWLLVLVGSSAVCYLIAENARRQGVIPWRKS